ncbi:hypothetical protein M422DRAFT_28395 [Sphaerobolus stellatus SS14]|nr:hypothetical protein M422DRAFT_28395 [Sphaerobolus stellatus SS14]
MNQDPSSQIVYTGTLAPATLGNEAGRGTTTPLIADMYAVAKTSEMIPIYTLPPEILDIIHDFVYRATKVKRTFAALQLSRVCRFWRDVAYNNPHLWTDIDFADARLALFCLKRSKDIGVKVTLQHQQILHPLISLRYILDPSEYENFRVSFNRIGHMDLAVALKDHAYHIEELFLVITEALHPSLTTYALAVVESMIAPRLRFFEVQMQQFPISINTGLFKGVFPALKTLILTHYLPTSSSPIWDALQGLEDLSLTVPVPSPAFAEYLGILRKLPTLRKLRILTPIERYTIANHPITQPSLELPFLTHCQIKLELPIVLNLLSAVSFPNLASLDLQVSPTAIVSDLEPLLPVLNPFALLNKVLIIQMSMREASKPGEPIQDFSVEGWSNLAKEPIFRLSSIQLTSITQIFNIFKEVQDVSLHGGRYPMGNLGRLPKAKMLYLQRTDIRILSEFYLYETVHHLQNLYLRDMHMRNRSDLVCNFRHIKKIKFSMCGGISEVDLARFTSKRLLVEHD